MIDFKEIAQANTGGGHQDQFELFARDFLEAIGYRIDRHPDRGADGKKDLIVSETRTGIGGETTIKWLVSCKHYAHSGKSVSDTDEPDILDRVNAHDCNGFIGVYSTIPSSSLSNKLEGLKDKIPSIIYDRGRVEQLIIDNSLNSRLLVRYFPNSFEKYHSHLYSKTPDKIADSTLEYKTVFTEEDLLRINLTAIVLIEVEKVKEEYFSSEWQERLRSLKKLYKFSDHSNDRVISEVCDFLNIVAHQTRARMPSNVASEVHALIITFFRPSVFVQKESMIDCAKQCINIGMVITYDALIHLNNYRIAQYGLSILKYIYRLSKKDKINILDEKVLETYNQIEGHLNRPERNDLENAKRLVYFFKEDLSNLDISFPVLPKELFALVEKDLEY